MHTPTLHLLVCLTASLSPKSVFASAVRDNTSPSPAFSAPFLQITPAPDPSHVSRRLHLLKPRQGPPRSPDGKTGFIGWYTFSDAWVSATCPSDDYFAADETYGVCCPRNTPYCDLATVCGGASNNFAVGPSGQADCGPTKNCDTITVLQTKGSDDAKRIIFCIAKSDQYVLPMTWYRVTFPLLEATVTVTESTTVTAIIQGGSSARGSDGSVHPPPVRWGLAVGFVSVLMLMAA
ncbi:hypothetical protein COL26b_013279 [Colletotrichum chrysophilum]|uniref:uncharacterized protein n=1 Tax=Colletotrichum chrysophilum TaxID=1836956 RepID=UPI0023018116|nr:uncharacterized protein COL26b_013279 [Colletotrichum chrysophilum]KAJ0362576.1 hypothetical protein COL26b_013279 [Colletotrichum chrysophilum]